ncbi:CRISPR-associated protein Cas4 [Haliovirga abyssi]|uniref:CRISPR-associated exonuclease Cas4 n=1 Tax=Haliovirga abyssi TaxID=2996794 RepID=A0AAU9DLR3_9FUSO|nr:CRISPR-associated protein Cas4 [Haliovirga abyssi]BDU50907.1 CRISPR-associated protein Cas4 [Haliovirga abyssi]
MQQENIKITGVMFYYYFVCKRKLWYFSKNISMENNSENVSIGKSIDENSYKKEKKHIMIDNTINIDFIEGYKVIHEIKKSKAIEEAGHWQIRYYQYYLKKNGVDNMDGIIDYPLLRKREKIVLTEKDEEKIENILIEIKDIIKRKEIPKKIDSKICKKCAYYELCYI